MKLNQRRYSVKNKILDARFGKYSEHPLCTNLCHRRFI